MVANIGDSRAVVGEHKDGKTTAFSLSIDQTPYRADERARVRVAGGLVMSYQQLMGDAPMHDNWGVDLGAETDTSGDPPRIWKEGMQQPGCAFTRSIGDSIGEDIGVTAEPELVQKELMAEDRVLIVASDGVWEFLTNQAVMDMISSFDEPQDACRAVVAESYRLWLHFDVRTDDITAIVAFLDHTATPAAADSQDAVKRTKPNKRGRRASASGVSVGLAIVEQGEAKPARAAPLTTPSVPARRKNIGTSHRERAPSSPSKDESTTHTPPPVVSRVARNLPKSSEESSRIATSLKSSFLFSDITPTQLTTLVGAFERRSVVAGEVVVRAGKPSECFYIVDAGEFTITSNETGNDVEVAHHSVPAPAMVSDAGEVSSLPSFGELALMYGKPSATTVTALSEGALWVLDRVSYTAAIRKQRDDASELLSLLEDVQVLQTLTFAQRQQARDLMRVESYKVGDVICAEGDMSTALFVLIEGLAKYRQGKGGSQMDLPDLKMIGPGDCFGERAISAPVPVPHGASVVCVADVKVRSCQAETPTPDLCP